MGVTITIEQGSETVEVSPLSYRDWTVEEFYGYGDPDGASANTPTDLEKSDVSRLFFYDGPKGLSLVIIHDEPNDGDGGRVVFEFDGLPSEGSWVVPDDGGEPSGSRGDWRWYSCCTDGGVFRGGLDGDFTITLDPEFGFGIGAWEVLSGDAADPAVITLDRSRRITLSGEGRNSVETDLTILSYIPGADEDSLNNRPGHPLNSAVPDFLDGRKTFEYDIETLDLGWLGEYDVDWDVLEVEATPPFDAWGTGDEITDLPSEDLSTAIRPREKHKDEFEGRTFNPYRVRNRIDVTFDSADGRQIDRDSLRVELGGERSDTVLEAEDLNTLNAELIGAQEIDGSYKFSGGRRRRFTNTRIIERDGVEAIQVSTIYGGFTKVARRVAEFAREYDDLRFLDEVLGWTFKVGGREVNDVVDELPDSIRSVVTPDFSGLIGAVAAAPNIFTFAEFTVFADGRRVVRLWDASRFPRHAMYVDGTRPDLAAASTNLPYEPRELANGNFIAFLAEAASRLVTPYYATEHAYKLHVLHHTFADTVEDVYEDIVDWIPGVDSDGLPDYTDLSSEEGIAPLHQFGFTADAQPLAEDEIDRMTPFLPLWPF